MKVISRAIAYKVKCEECLSILQFTQYEMSTNAYSFGYEVKCPVCNNHISVATNNNNKTIMHEKVVPLYKEENNG